MRNILCLFVLISFLSCQKQEIGTPVQTITLDLHVDQQLLHGADLLAKVWDSNETNMNKLYIQNTKLRTILKELGDGFDIVSMDRSHFRFIFPYSQAGCNVLKM